MNQSVKLTKEMAAQTADEVDKMKMVPCQEAVGSVMYLAQCTRPDILFAVNQLSRFNSNPGPMQGRCETFVVISTRYIETQAKLHEARRFRIEKLFRC